MVPLQVEAAGPAGTVAFEVETPDRAADALGKIVDGRRRAGGDPPAGRGGARLGRAGLTKQKPHHAAFAGTESEDSPRATSYYCIKRLFCQEVCLLVFKNSMVVV